MPHLAPIELVYCMLEAMGAVSTLHYLGYYHNDIKPDNFLLQRQIRNFVICDYDQMISRFDFGSITYGTSGYTSEEFCKGIRNVNTDLFALSRVIRQILEIFPSSSIHMLRFQVFSFLSFAIDFVEPTPLKRLTNSIVAQNIDWIEPWYYIMSHPNSAPTIYFCGTQAIHHADLDYEKVGSIRYLAEGCDLEIIKDEFGVSYPSIQFHIGVFFYRLFCKQYSFESMNLFGNALYLDRMNIEFYLDAPYQSPCFSINAQIVDYLKCLTSDITFGPVSALMRFKNFLKKLDCPDYLEFLHLFELLLNQQPNRWAKKWIQKNEGTLIFP